MKSLLMILALTFSAQAFSRVDFFCADKEGRSTIHVEVDGNEANIRYGRVNAQSQVDVRMIGGQRLYGIGAADFFLQILDNGKEVLPAVMTMNDRNFVEMSCTKTEI